MTIKVYISLEISVTGTAHIEQLGNILVPRSFLLTGYQPWEGKAGRGVGARVLQLTQPSSFWPSDNDTNPPGQPSSLMDLSFSVFAVLALKKHAGRQQTAVQAIQAPAAISLQDGPDFTWSEGWIRATARPSTGFWGSDPSSTTVLYAIAFCTSWEGPQSQTQHLGSAQGQDATSAEGQDATSADGQW